MTVLASKQEQGHIVIGLAETLATLPDSYDALATFARSLVDLPKEVDWPFIEPNALDDIWDAWNSTASASRRRISAISGCATCRSRRRSARSARCSSRRGLTRSKGATRMRSMHG